VLVQVVSPAPPPLTEVLTDMAQSREKMAMEAMKACPVKRLIKKCEHNRQKSQCKDCRGSGICDHNRQRRLCKDCGGSGD